MHEMGIANSILQAVRKECRLHPGARATKVGVRIGELAAIDADSLRFCFETLACDTACPQCHRRATECISGDELELVYLEVEEDEPRAVGTKSSE